MTVTELFAQLDAERDECGMHNREKLGAGTGGPHR
jgi:hypothetical protein